MIMDYESILSSAQAVTASAASTSYIDLGAAGSAVSDEPYVVVRVDTAPGSAGSGASCAFSIQTDDNTSFSSPTTLHSTAAIAQADLTAGTMPVKVRLPRGLQRYLRVYYTLSGENFTSGKFDAFITPGVEHRS